MMNEAELMTRFIEENTDIALNTRNKGWTIVGAGTISYLLSPVLQFNIYIFLGMGGEKIRYDHKK